MSDNSELKYAVEFLRDDAKRHNPHDYADSVQWSAADALEALAGEVELVRAERHRAQTACEQIAVRLHAAEAERDRLKATLVRTAASLAAAISLLERGGKAAKRAAPSNKMFDQMLVDYNRALDDARTALEETT